MNANLESALSLILDGLWRATWQATALAIVVLVLQRALDKRLGGRGRFALWAVVVARLLLPALPQSRISVFNLARSRAVVKSVMPTQGQDVTDHIPIVVLGARSAKPQAAEGSSVALPTLAPVAERKVISWKLWIAAGWLAGIFALALRVAQACWELSLTIRTLSVVSEEGLLRVVQSCADRLKLRRIPRILAGDTVQTPAVVGLFRPKLLLPSRVLAKCDPREIRLIILHELAHLKRHDIASNWLIALASLVHWFNPVVWLLGARMRADRELACDELVLAISSGEARVYGQTLVKLIEILSPFARTLAVSPRQLAIVGILETTTPMQRRVRMIAQFNPNQSRRWVWTSVVLALLACGALTDAVRGENKSRGASSQPTTQLAIENVIDGSQNDAELQKALATILPEAKFDKIGFEAVMDFLRDKTAANLVVSWRVLESAGIDRNTEISMSLKNITLRQAIDHVLSDVDPGSAVNLGYTIQDGAIVISTRDDLARHTKTVAYDVRDLLGSQEGKPHQEAVERLVQVIEDMADRDSWQDNGGTTGTIREFNGKLLIQNNAAAHEKVEKVLKLLKSEQPQPLPAGFPGGPGVSQQPVQFQFNGMAPPQVTPLRTIVSDEEIEAANRQAMTSLKKKLPEVKFEGVALSDVIDFYRDVTGVNIVVNWQALEIDNIKQDARITLRLKDASLESVLNATLRQVNSQNLMLVIDRGVITITTRNDLPSYLLTKTYDVKTLAETPQDMQSLSQVIQNLTGPQESVQYFGNKLIITATSGTHEQVQKLLAELSGAKPTTQPAHS